MGVAGQHQSGTRTEEALRNISMGSFDGKNLSDPLPYPLWVDLGADNYAESFAGKETGTLHGLDEQLVLLRSDTDETFPELYDASSGLEFEIEWASLDFGKQSLSRSLCVHETGSFIG